MVDARPENYWLAELPGKLVDLGSIKPLTKQNLFSFETDFGNYFLNPLILEKELEIPISHYFQGNLSSCNINHWNILGSYFSITKIKKTIKLSLVKYFSNLISSSSTEFINYLNDSASAENQEPSIKKSLKSIKNIKKLLDQAKPNLNLNSDWDNYLNVHNSDYVNKKTNLINQFLNECSENGYVVDLGSNLTTLKSEKIKVRIDNDMAICRQMRNSLSSNNIVLQLDIAKALSNINDYNFNALNLSGNARYAVMTSIIHHLIIDYGLKPDIFYKNLSLLYDEVLLEFPSKEDPMVQLLMRKKNEFIKWDWESNQLDFCSKYFEISNKTILDETRIAFTLKNRNIK